MIEDQQRWNHRYQSALPGAPRAFLVEMAALIPLAGRALDLACGTGAEALWLAERGLLVDAVDVADAGLAVARAALAAAGLSPRVRLVHADLDHGVPPTCQGPYQLICALHFRGVVLEQAIMEHLAPNGVVVATRLSVLGRAPDPDHGPDPAFLAGPGELRELAVRCGLDVLEHREGNGEALLVALHHRSGVGGGAIEAT
ncbi:MAG: class I SAM-dependent methyltransferase [Acidimicrobiales bacterium]